MKSEMAKQATQYEGTISALRSHSNEAKIYTRDSVHTLSAQVDVYKLQLEQAKEEISRLEGEVAGLRAEAFNYSDSLKGHQELVQASEEQKVRLDAAERKVKELEAEIAGYGEWKKLEDVFQMRLARASDLERECERLQRDNKSLAETIGNKLLLEEQVHDLKSRLENQTRRAAENIDLDTKLKAAEQEIKAWKKMTAELCSANTLATPHALRAYVDRLQKQHLVLADGSSTAKLEKSEADAQMHELRAENELNAQKVTSLTTTIGNYKSALHRLQKRLMLIARERDCFKNLLENYEKDLTITANAADTHGDNELKSRLDVLEKSLAGYKEICNALEKELVETRSAGEEMSGGVQPTSEYTERLHEQINELRTANERLQRRKDELEEVFEQDRMKQAYDLGASAKELKVCGVICFALSMIELELDLKLIICPFRWCI